MNKKSILITSIIFLSLILRLGYIIFIVGDRGYGAESEFITYTENLIKFGEYFEYTKTENSIKRYAIRLPLWPYVLYFHHKLFGEDFLYYTRFTLVFLSTFIVFFNYKIAQKLFNNTIVSYIALLISAVYPRYIYNCKDLNPTIFYTFLVTIIIYLMTIIYTNKQITYKRMILFGVVMGIAHLTRSFLMFFIVPITFLNIYYTDIRNGIKKSILFLISFTIIISPWLYRNYKLFNKFIPGTTHFAIALYAGNNEKVLDNIAKAWDYNDISDIMLTKPELESNEIAMQKVKEFIFNNPGKFLYLCWNRTIRLWRLFPIIRYVGLKYALFSLLSYGVLFVFFIGGLFYTRLDYKKYLSFYLLMLYFTAISAVVVSYTRYRLYFTSLIITFGAVGIYKFVKNIRLIKIQENQSYSGSGPE